MKALTLHQPYATAVADGIKTVETRSWQTHHRGAVAIHAAKRIDHEALWRARLVDARHHETELPLGAIVAMARIVRMVPANRVALNTTVADGWNYAAWTTRTTDHDGQGHDQTADWVRHEQLDVDLANWTLGQYGAGRWAWVLTMIEPLDQPIPCRGYQGLWTIPQELQP